MTASASLLGERDFTIGVLGERDWTVAVLGEQDYTSALLGEQDYTSALLGERDFTIALLGTLPPDFNTYYAPGQWDFSKATNSAHILTAGF